jgi:hypothetical protein
MHCQLKPNWAQSMREAGKLVSVNNQWVISKRIVCSGWNFCYVDKTHQGLRLLNL